MNRQPYGRPPRWWEPQLSPTWVRLTAGIRLWRLKSSQRLYEIEPTGLEHLQAAADAKKGILLVANHSAHYDSEALYAAADRIQLPLYFMTAWQAFDAMSAPVQRAMQWMGCFSIDRESTDRQAFKQGVSILQEQPYPLVIFPEGDIYHTTDRVTPFREGAAAIALSAAKRSEREIVVVPCGIKFFYLDDLTPQLEAAMDQLEERAYLRPHRGRPLKQRVYRLAEGFLALKELDYLGATREGPVPERVVYLIDAVLSKLEEQHGLRSNGGTSERVKALRQAIIKKTDEALEAAAQNGKRKKRGPGPFDQDMEDVFFVMQLYSYPGDYLSGEPSVERIAETIDKFEEDVLGRKLPTVRGRRRVELSFGEPIPVTADEGKRRSVTELTHTMQSRVQSIIDAMNARRGS